MTLQEIYQSFIRQGIQSDPRGKKGIERLLRHAKENHKDLSKTEKEWYDSETLSNPYSDTRILFGDPTTFVNKVLVGIDISSAELLLADRLNEKGEGIDLVIAHHPEGRALAAIDEVMDLQVDLLSSYGVPINVAESMLTKRIAEVYRRFSPINHSQAVDTARILTLPFMCVHTPADNIGWNVLSTLIEPKEFDRVGEVIDVLLTIPELKEAMKGKAGPTLFVGNKTSRAGKVKVVEFTGGTEGAKEVYEKLSHAGVGTIIGMHVSEEHRKEAEKHHMNLVVTGHMASDSIGMNILMDSLEKQGVSVIPCSGMIRVKRN